MKRKRQQQQFGGKSGLEEARNDVLEAVVSNYTDEYGLDPSMKENVASESEQEKEEDVDSDAEVISINFNCDSN